MTKVVRFFGWTTLVGLIGMGVFPDDSTGHIASGITFGFSINAWIISAAVRNVFGVRQQVRTDICQRSQERIALQRQIAKDTSYIANVVRAVRGQR